MILISHLDRNFFIRTFISEMTILMDSGEIPSLYWIKSIKGDKGLLPMTCIYLMESLVKVRPDDLVRSCEHKEIVLNLMER